MKIGVPPPVVKDFGLKDGFADLGSLNTGKWIVSGWQGGLTNISYSAGVLSCGSTSCSACWNANSYSRPVEMSFLVPDANDPMEWGFATNAGATFNGYSVNLDSTPSVQFRKWTAGAASNLGSAVSFTVSTGTRYKFSISANGLLSFVNSSGTVIATATDTTFTGPFFVQIFLPFGSLLGAFYGTR